MFLGTYSFKGKSDELLNAYDRLMASMPNEGLELHVCSQTSDGMVIFDACPTKEAFDDFANGDMLRDAMVAVGLPKPEISYIGDVHTVYWANERKL